MAFRYTIAEVKNKDSKEYMSDFRLLTAILNERQQTLTNIYSPLYQRINQLKNKISTLSDNKKDIEDVYDSNKILISKEDLLTFMNDVMDNQGNWSDTSYPICKFIGVDPTQGT